MSFPQFSTLRQSGLPRIFAAMLCLVTLVLGAGLSAHPAFAAKPAPAQELVKAVDIPHQKFTLENGLRVLVHTDRKAPIVAVSIWYDVGSKHEPEGKTGYAHLFEHLMFNGSENAPGDFFGPLKQIGATDFNGTTWLDRTNYFQTVPTSALEVALFLESDRMGHLLGAVTQEKLDNQIGVVSNEKRQGDNQPFGLVDYRQTELLFPKGHPYGHSTIGSLKDLKAATLEDMHAWFKDHYGPNNAILVLAGDIDVKTAKPLVQKWFGDIARGKPAPQITAGIPTLEKPVYEVMQDRVATSRIYRNWTIPGLNDPDYTALNVGATVLGGLASSRLDNIMVRDEKNAVAVRAFTLPFVHAGIFEISIDVKPGEDVDKAAKRLDDIVANFIANGPTKDEVNRVVTRNAAARIGGLEQVGGFSGKAVALAQGELYTGDSNYYKKELARLAAQTPQSVTAAMQKWLRRPVVGIRVVPGDRGAAKQLAQQSDPAKTLSDQPVLQAEKFDGSASEPSYYQQPETASTESEEGAQPAAKEDASAKRAIATDRSVFPAVGEIPNVNFPEVKTATLSNGIKVYFAERNAVPITRISLSFDAGSASDPAEKLGLHNFVTAIIPEGTDSLNSRQIAEQQERLGANISVGGGRDRTSISLSSVNPNLDSGIELLADIAKNPAFREDDVERIRVQQLTTIDVEQNQPRAIASNLLPQLIFGEAHPYGRGLSGNGTKTSVQAITRDDLIRYHQQWLRPEKATIFAVGNVRKTKLIKKLERHFGKWSVAGTVAPDKNFDIASPEKKGRIIVVHRPNSPQSFILAGQLTPHKGTDDLLKLNASNEVLGGSFLSRINLDLRETKGWSYGTRNTVLRGEHDVSYIMRAPVQTDKTGPAVAAMLAQVNAFVGEKGVTAEELERTINGNVRQLPGRYERSGTVLGQIQRDVMLQRPSNYAETVAEQYKALTAADLDRAMREAIETDKFTWVIVGDVSKIKPQIDALNIETEYRGYDAAETNVNSDAVLNESTDAES